MLSAAQACSTKSNVKVTFFGYPDNDPPSGQIAYNCGRGFTAGGSGTYDDPVTFASATNGIFTKCEIIYIPYLKKYGRFEDYCGQCGKDWTNQQLVHIDIWTGSPDVSGGSAQINCENTLTRESKSIVKSPGQGLEVDSSSLFEGGSCSTNNIYQDPALSTLCSSNQASVPSGSTGSSGTTGCEWEGHCEGASCTWYGDCSGSLICTDGQCAPAAGLTADSEPLGIGKRGMRGQKLRA